MANDILLEVNDLSVEFQTDKGLARALDKISFKVKRGETLGLVGESGCGKSVTALSILGLIPSPPGKIVEGSIIFNGRNLVELSETEYRQIRGRHISMVFQEPMTALNPVFKISTQMIDVIRQHQRLSRKEALNKAIAMLDKVGIPSPSKRIHEYPHELSGGMRQRVMIAMALSCGPELLLADEPTTALDVTTQAQVMEEFKRLQEELQMAVVLVTHDLGVVAETCQRVIVMYCGKIVEMADIYTIFEKPRHPYTHGLLRSVPVIRDKKLKRLPTIEGMVPDLLHLPQGCRFADRCHRAQQKCHKEVPSLDFVDKDCGHAVACFYPEE